jgi:hypothetical protein
MSPAARPPTFVPVSPLWRRGRAQRSRSVRCLRRPARAALRGGRDYEREREADRQWVRDWEERERLQEGGREGEHDGGRPTPPRRIPRRSTHRASNWPWARSSRADRSVWLVRWLRASLLGVAGSPVFAAVAEIGTLMLGVFSDALERSLYPDVETELVVEYGITKPSPGDRTYVDPLREWELSRVTYYYDSFGRRVYPQLQAEGTGACVGPVEYVDLADEDADLPADPHPSEQRRAVGGNRSERTPQKLDGTRDAQPNGDGPGQRDPLGRPR